MTPEFEMNGQDIKSERLKPLHKRDINLQSNAGFRKIVASIKAIGLIEPLAVYQENDGDCYMILDGYLRFMACQKLGIQTIPCIVYKDNQAYSYNKNVNRLSAYQEMRMLRRSLETIEESTIAKTLGIKSIRHRLAPTLVGHLHKEVVKAFQENMIGKKCAIEFTAVVPERQAEILKEMKKVNDFTPAFSRLLALKSPMSMKTRKGQQRKAWAANDEHKKNMVSRMANAEKQHDFYSGLYRQYSADLMKMTFYCRKLITHPRIAAYLKTNHDDVLGRLSGIIFETGA